MSAREFRFRIDGTPKLEIRLPVGEVRIVEGTGNDVLVQLDGKEGALDRFVVEQRGRGVYLEPERGGVGWKSAVDVTIHAGAAPEVHARLTAANLNAVRSLAALSVETASGDVDVANVAGDVHVRSAAGDVRVGDIGGQLEATTASGDVRAGAVTGRVMVRTASGDVHVVSAGDEVVAKSASGDVIVGVFTGSRFEAKTMSGDTTVGVTSGRKFEVSFQTLSGDVRTDFPVSKGSPAGRSARLAVKSVSGDIRIHAAKE